MFFETSKDCLVFSLKDQIFIIKRTTTGENQLGNEILVVDTKNTSTSGPSNDDKSVISNINAFSINKNLVAITNEAKDLIVYDLHTGESKYQTKLQKRANSICWGSTHEVIVADKFGDVYRFNIQVKETTSSSSSASNIAVLLVGHVSMIMDMTLSPNQKYILTSDRDEKIRITHYPRTFNIHSFLLGHKDLVSSMAFLPCKSNSTTNRNTGYNDLSHNQHQEERWLVSSSGDNHIITWDYLSNTKPVSDLDISEECDEAIRKLIILENANFIAVLYEGSNKISFVRYSTAAGALSLIKTISLNDTILNMTCFENNLYVLLNGQEQVYISICQYTSQDDFEIVRSFPVGDDQYAMVNLFNDKKIPALTNIDLPLKVLRKETISEKMDIKNKRREAKLLAKKEKEEQQQQAEEESVQKKQKV